MIKRKLALITGVAVIASIFLCTPIGAQEVTKGVKKGGGRGYFLLGGTIIDIKNLNLRLENKGYPKLSGNFISLGGGGHGIIGKVIIGGEGHGLIGRKTTSGSYETSIGASYGFFKLGYIVYSAKRLSFYPFLGLGGGGISLEIVKRETAPSFDDVLDNPKRSTKLSTGSFLLNLALGIDYLLKLGGNEEGEGGLVFGLHIGYTFAPIKGNWEMDGIDISGGPEIGITGPYIRLMIGGGGSRRE